MPGYTIRQLRQFEAVHLPVHVHGHIDEVVGHTVGGGILPVQHERHRQVVVATFWLPRLHPMPREVWTAQSQIVLVAEVFVVTKHFMLTAELDDMLEIAEDVGVLL